MSVLSFVSHNWEWLALGLLATLALALGAFYLRNWRLALGAAGIVGAYFAAQGMYSAGYRARVADDVAAQTRVLRSHIDAMESAAEGDKTRGETDAAEIRRLRDLVDATPANPAPSLPRDAAKRIGAVK